MTVTTEEAIEIAALFGSASESAPLRQIRDEMRYRSREWTRAVGVLDEMGEGWVIDLVGSVTPYMRVAAASGDGHMEGQSVVRVIHRDGGCTVHYEDAQSGRPVYINCHSAASPCVVKR